MAVEKSSDQSVNLNLYFSRFNRLAIVSAATHTQAEDARSSITTKSDDEEADIYLKQYATKLPCAEVNVVEFWKIHQTEFPRLSGLAFELLSIPAASAAVERVFFSSWSCNRWQKMPDWSSVARTGMHDEVQQKIFLNNF